MEKPNREGRYIMKRPIRLTVIAVGILLLGVLLWFSPTRIYCLRPYPPPTWDNPPIPSTAKDTSIAMVDKVEGPTLVHSYLHGDDNSTILHKVVTYKVDKTAQETEEWRDLLFWFLVRDCWNFTGRTSPGAGGIQDVDHGFEWTNMAGSAYFYDMVTRQLPSGHIQVIIHTRRTVDK